MKTLVIGGGISGVVAARTLDHAGMNVVLIEPRPRLGGRIRTEFSRAHGFAVDLGPEFVHGNPPETRALVANAPYDIIPLLERERVFWRGQTSDYDAAQGERTFEALLPGVPDRAAGRALDDLNLDEFSTAMARAFIEGFNAADAHRLSLNAMVYETRASSEDLLKNFRLLPGYQSLVDHVAATFTRVDVRLGERVTHLGWQPGRVLANIFKLGGGYDETFDRVVCTVPTSCIDQIQFEPPLEGHRAAARALPLGDVQKVTFIFREALWEIPPAVGVDFLHAPEMTFNTRWAWGFAKPFTVTCWAGGRRATKLRDLEESAIVDLALEELARACGREASTLRGLVDEIFHHDWGKDPFSRGAYSYAVVGGAGARKALGTTVRDTLYFAGEATDVSGAPGTVHGAIRSGLRAAQAVLSTGAV